MTKNAIVHVENTDNLLEFASYLNSAGWNILSANKTKSILEKENIPVIHEPGLTLNSLFVNETSQLIRRILFTRYPDEYSSNEESDNNIYIVCMNVTPKIGDVYSLSNDKIKSNMECFQLSSILRNSFSNYSNLLILTDPADYKEAIIQLRTNKISPDFRLYLAGKALNLIAAYDSGISYSILENSEYSSSFLNYFIKPYKKFMMLSNGANEHQQGWIYKSPVISGALNGFPKIKDEKLKKSCVEKIQN